MKNWVNKTKTVVTTAAIFFALLGQNTELINQNKEVYVKESVRATYTTPEIPDYGQEGVESTPDTLDYGQEDIENTSDVNNELGYRTEFKDEEIMYSSYYSYGAGCFSVELVKQDLDVTTEGTIAPSMENTGIASSQQLLDACLSETEKAELEAGSNIEIRVVMKQMVKEGLTDNQDELMEQAMEEYTKLYKGFQVGS